MEFKVIIGLGVCASVYPHSGLTSGVVGQSPVHHLCGMRTKNSSLNADWSTGTMVHSVRMHRVCAMCVSSEWCLVPGLA